MVDQYHNIESTLQSPDEVIESKSDKNVELYYRKYFFSPVGEKFLCVVVKDSLTDYFMLTAYFTDTIKKGNTIWKKK
jgi:molybdopterin synthase catalytic subunit